MRTSFLPLVLVLLLLLMAVLVAVLVLVLVPLLNKIVLVLVRMRLRRACAGRTYGQRRSTSAAGAPDPRPLCNRDGVCA